MSITAAQVITAARDEHTAFSEQRTPNLVLLRHLEQYHRRLAQLITDRNSSVLAVETIIAIQTFNFTTGLTTFPAHLFVLPDGEVAHPTDRNRSDRSPFSLIGMNVRLHTRPVFSGWFTQGTLFLQGDLQDWGDATNLHISYVAIPTGPIAVTDNFDPIPDSVFDVLVTRCSRFMAKRGSADQGLPPIDGQSFANDFAVTEERFLSEMKGRMKARLINTLDIFPAG